MDSSIPFHRLRKFVDAEDTIREKNRTFDSTLELYIVATKLHPKRYFLKSTIQILNIYSHKQRIRKSKVYPNLVKIQITVTSPTILFSIVFEENEKRKKKRKFFLDRNHL